MKNEVLSIPDKRAQLFFFLEVIGVIRSFEQGYNRIITRKVIVQRMLEELQLWLDKEAIATLCV